jgi:threonine dehydratase
MAGVATVFKALRPQAKIIGCQASGAPAMVRSIREGKAISTKSVETFADGIALMRASEKMRKILSASVDEWLEVDEDSIATAVLTLLEKAKVVAEGSGAVPLAALGQMRKKVKGKNVVLIVSGGNIDVNVLSRIIDLGLIRAGRRVRVNVLLSDRPGSLARLTDLIAKQGANILQAIHDRSEPSTKIDQTEVALTLETRGPEHSAGVIEALRNHVLRLELAH